MPRQMTTAVSHPGETSEHRSFVDVLPVAPQASDVNDFIEKVEDLRRAERSAEEQARAIRLR